MLVQRPLLVQSNAEFFCQSVSAPRPTARYVGFTPWRRTRLLAYRRSFRFPSAANERTCALAVVSLPLHFCVLPCSSRVSFLCGRRRCHVANGGALRPPATADPLEFRTVLRRSRSVQVPKASPVERRRTAGTFQEVSVLRVSYPRPIAPLVAAAPEVMATASARQAKRHCLHQHRPLSLVLGLGNPTLP